MEVNIDELAVAREEEDVSARGAVVQVGQRTVGRERRFDHLAVLRAPRRRR